MKEKPKGISYVMVVLLFVSMFLVAKEAASLVMSERLKGVDSNLVVIDAGHGKTAGRPKEFELECSVLSSVSCGGSII